MAFRYDDRVKQLISSGPGSGVLTFTSTPTGFIPFSSIASIANGDIVPYEIWDSSTMWESGYGTYNTGGTLTRTTVKRNSAGTTVPLNFTNPVTVWCAAIAASLALKDVRGNMMLGGGTPQAWGATLPAMQFGNGGAVWGNTAGDSVAVSSNLYNDGTDYRRISTGAAAMLLAVSGGFTWYTGAAGAANGTLTPTAVAELNAGGNVGFGISPSGWGASYTGLQLKAGFSAWGSATDGAVGSNTYFDGTSHRRIGTGATSLYAFGGGFHTWLNGAAGAANGTYTTTQIMTTDASGNLLVGPAGITRAGAANLQAGVTGGLFTTWNTTQNVGGGATSLVFTGLNTDGAYIATLRGSGPNGEVGSTFLINGGSSNVLAGVQVLSNFSYPGGDLTANPVVFGGGTAYQFSPTNAGKFQINVQNNTGQTVTIYVNLVRIF